MKWVILFLLVASVVAAQDIIRSGDITLLALAESDGVKSGSVAHLFLELHPGSERVFLETYPMTKVTTQASLRFAQQIACRQVNADCSKFDFFFTIKAMPGIVGGPSAGSAAAFLTAALLSNMTVPSDLAMTGTINSGGIIGPVGGLKHKVIAASNNSIKTVFIPTGTREVEEDNESVDLVQLGSDINITVREISTLGEALELSLGIPQEEYNESLNIEERYQRIMREVSNDLCDRTYDYLKKPLKANLSIYNLTERADRDQSQGAYYAAASYCFRANVEYKRAWYNEQNFSKDELVRKISLLQKECDDIAKQFERRVVSSLGDVQTLMAVLERVGEAREALVDAAKSLEENDTSVAPEVGYAEERLFSAVTWARFFGYESGNGFVVDHNSLKYSCIAKISEAEERYNYVKSIVPEALDATRKDIDHASELLNEENYIMCLYVGSKAKAAADVVLSLLGVEEARFDDVIALKLDIARQALIKAQRNNFFPIIAYSYYEYAGSLKDFDRISSLLFTEYALELASIDMYFKEKIPEPVPEPPSFSVPSEVFIFVIGFALGGLFFMVLTRNRHKPVRSSRR